MAPVRARRLGEASVLAMLLGAPALANAQSPASGAPAPTPAASTPRERRAQELFVRGQALLRENQVAAACAVLAESLAVDPALGTLLNLALCHERDGKLASAWKEYGQASEWARRGGEPERQRREFAEERARTLRASIPKLSIWLAGPTPGLRILLDQRALLPGELTQETALDPGDHELVVESGGQLLMRASVVAEVGRTTIVTVVLPRIDVPRQHSDVPPRAASTGNPAAGTSPPLDPVRSPSSWNQSPSTFVYTAGVVGVLGLGAGTYLLVRANALETEKERGQREAERTVDPEQARKYQRESRDAHASSVDHQLAGFVSGGLGILALGASVYLHMRSSASVRAEIATHFELTPLAHGGKFTLRGDF
jgi:hypothetical protein